MFLRFPVALHLTLVRTHDTRHALFEQVYNNKGCWQRTRDADANGPATYVALRCKTQFVLRWNVNQDRPLAGVHEEIERVANRAMAAEESIDGRGGKVGPVEELSREGMILFGCHAADIRNVSVGAWDKLVELMELPVRIAEEEGVTLVAETGNNAMITSAYLGRRLIDELGTDHLKLLWDPCNSLYCNEPAHPDGYDALQGGYLGHIHLKDSLIDIPRATVQCTALGEGHVAPYLELLAKALKLDGYKGAISLESVYRPAGGTFEDGFRASINTMKRLFS